MLSLSTSHKVRCIHIGVIFLCPSHLSGLHCLSTALKVDLFSKFFCQYPYFLFFFFSFFLFFFFSFLSGNAVLQLHTEVFTFLQHCCYVVVCLFCSLLDGVCLSGNKRITYLLTLLYALPIFRRDAVVASAHRLPIFSTSARRDVLLSASGRLQLPALDFGTVYLLTSGLPRHSQHFVGS